MAPEHKNTLSSVFKNLAVKLRWLGMAAMIAALFVQQTRGFPCLWPMLLSLLHSLPKNSKVLRSAAGAHFRIHLHLDVEWELLPGNHVSENATVVLAESIGPKVATSKSRRHSNQELVNDLVKAEEEIKNAKSIEVMDGGSILHRDTSYSDASILKLYKQLPLSYSAYDGLSIGENPSVVLVISSRLKWKQSSTTKERKCRLSVCEVDLGTVIRHEIAVYGRFRR